MNVGAGQLSENVTTACLNLERMPLGTFLELGPSALIELTGLRTPVFSSTLPDGFETAGGLVGGNGLSIQTGLLGGQGQRSCRGWRYARVRLPSSLRASPAL